MISLEDSVLYKSKLAGRTLKNTNWSTLDAVTRLSKQRRLFSHLLFLPVHFPGAVSDVSHNQAITPHELCGESANHLLSRSSGVLWSQLPWFKTWGGQRELGHDIQGVLYSGIMTYKGRRKFWPPLHDLLLRFSGHWRIRFGEARKESANNKLFLVFKYKYICDYFFLDCSSQYPKTMNRR